MSLEDKREDPNEIFSICTAAAETLCLVHRKPQITPLFLSPATIDPVTLTNLLSPIGPQCHGSLYVSNAFCHLEANPGGIILISTLTLSTSRAFSHYILRPIKKTHVSGSLVRSGQSANKNTAPFWKSVMDPRSTVCKPCSILTRLMGTRAVIQAFGAHSN